MRVGFPGSLFEASRKAGPKKGGQSYLGRLRPEEKEMIEAALRESGGRVSGPSGAAVNVEAFSKLYLRLKDQIAQDEIEVASNLHLPRQMGNI